MPSSVGIAVSSESDAQVDEVAEEAELGGHALELGVALNGELAQVGTQRS
jgi:hypothetical protein